MVLEGVIAFMAVGRLGATVAAVFGGFASKGQLGKINLLTRLSFDLKYSGFAPPQNLPNGSRMPNRQLSCLPLAVSNRRALLTTRRLSMMH